MMVEVRAENETWYEHVRPSPRAARSGGRHKARCDSCSAIAESAGATMDRDRVQGPRVVAEEKCVRRAGGDEPVSRWRPQWRPIYAATESPSETRPRGLVELRRRPFDHFRESGLPEGGEEKQRARARLIACGTQRPPGALSQQPPRRPAPNLDRTGRAFFHDREMTMRSSPGCRRAVDGAGMWAELDTTG